MSEQTIVRWTIFGRAFEYFLSFLHYVKCTSPLNANFWLETWPRGGRRRPLRPTLMMKTLLNWIEKWKGNSLAAEGWKMGRVGGSSCCRVPDQMVISFTVSCVQGLLSQFVHFSTPWAKMAETLGLSFDNRKMFAAETLVGCSKCLPFSWIGNAVSGISQDLVLATEPNLFVDSFVGNVSTNCHLFRLATLLGSLTALLDVCWLFDGWKLISDEISLFCFCWLVDLTDSSIRCRVMAAHTQGIDQSDVHHEQVAECTSWEKSSGKR